MASKSLWRSARPLVVGRAISAVVGLALPAVLARLLDRGQYGTYKQVYLVANLATYSLQLGLAQSLFYFIPRGRTDEERRPFIAQALVSLSLLGVLTGSGLVAFGPFIARHFSNPDLGRLTLPVALLAGSLLASAPLEIGLTAQGKPEWSATALVVSDLVRVTAMLAAILTGHGLTGLVWAAALAALARWVATLVLFGGAFRSLPTWSSIKVQLAYALPFGVAVLLRQQQLQLHQVYIAARATPALFALYAVGCTQIPVVSLLYSPVSETLQVRLAALDRASETSKSAQLFVEAVEKLATAFLPLSALLIATARPVIEILFGAKYAAAAPVMRIAVVAVAVQSLPVDAVLKARARTPTLFLTYAGKLAVTWPALAVGWTLDGMTGVIAAHVGVDLLSKLAQLLIVAVDLEVGMADLLGGRAMLRTIAAAMAGGTLGAAVTGLVHEPLLACLLAGPATISFSAWDYLDRRRRARRGPPKEAQDLGRGQAA